VPSTLRIAHISSKGTSGAAEDAPRSKSDAKHLRLANYEGRSFRRRNCIENTSRHVHGCAWKCLKVVCRELEPVAKWVTAVRSSFHVFEAFRAVPCSVLTRASGGRSICLSESC